MTRSARRRAAFANLAPSSLSADRQEAVKRTRKVWFVYKKARRKVEMENSAARGDSPYWSPPVAFIDAELEQEVDDISTESLRALMKEELHYSNKCKPRKWQSERKLYSQKY